MNEMKIPKIIHFIWVGGGKKNELINRCIESWKKYCPDYEIKEWNEKNFDMNQNLYLKQAYENKKYAFVSDYIRLKVLYDYGGIYVDTDVEIVKPMDEFLKHRAFTGFENTVWMPTAVMGAEPHHPWIKRLLNVYDHITFLDEKGNFNLTTNVSYMSVITRHFYKVKLNNTYQELNDGIVVYTDDWFCPKDYVTEKILSTENTHAIHHFNGSWLSSGMKKLDKVIKALNKCLGNKIFSVIVKRYQKQKAKKDMKNLAYLFNKVN